MAALHTPEGSDSDKGVSELPAMEEPTSPLLFLHGRRSVVCWHNAQHSLTAPGKEKATHSD